ncbi:MAG: VOC family protein [Asticcacaulis sp.]|nr:VOC family protein [Asticcacaulis sp.]
MTQPSHMQGVIPYLCVVGASDAADFYQKAFGAEELKRMPTDDGRLMHCHLKINNGSLMLSDSFPEHGYEHQPSHSFLMTLVVDDAEPWWNRAVEAGCTIVLPLDIQFWGDRYGQVRDPYGVLWAVNQPLNAAA